MMSYANSAHRNGDPEGTWIVIEGFGICDRGRPTNDDHFLLADMEKSVLVTESNVPADDIPPFVDAQSQVFLVAHGVGAALGGQRASLLAAEVMFRHVADSVPVLLSTHHARVPDVERQMRAAMQHCQTESRRTSAHGPGSAPAWSMLTAAHLLWPNLCVGHVGTSRCYLLRNADLMQLTTDHTFEIGDGRRALGGMAGATPEVFTLGLCPGDALLLCTHGLTTKVRSDQMRNAMMAASSAEEACEWLVLAARAAGATGDVTVVVVRLPLAGRAMTPSGSRHASATTSGGQRNLRDQGLR
ncbi:MAG TPA: protein phosphatase 2C domain-containing protein [Planctomycetota bacterium]|nr:protein phosphatase 2C domain-containing protein [Planctomycetota bacterium]